MRTGRYIMSRSVIQSASLIASCLAASLALTGCAAGIGKPDVSDAQKPPRDVGLTLYAAPNLNAANDSRPLALVVRLYTLKDPTSFQQASFDTFTDPVKEKTSLGGDLLGVRELTLIPGQRYMVSEKVSREAQAFGIVALFRDPALQRWKFAFDPGKSERSGIIIGLHSCAMTVTNGIVIQPDQGPRAQQLNMLSSVRCG